MDTGLLPTERTQVLQAGMSARGQLVLPLTGARQQRVAAADARARHRAASIWIRAAAHPAHAGGLADRPQPGAPAVQAGGPPGAYENPPAQTDQFAPRPGADGYGRQSVLGDGFCA